jgi:hypothetical protein
LVSEEFQEAALCGMSEKSTTERGRVNDTAQQGAWGGRYMRDDDLYKFLMERSECHLYQSKDDVEAWFCVDFPDIEDFIDAIGPYSIAEHGLEVTLKDGYIAIDLYSVIEGTGAELIDYKECFGDEWYEYFSKEE